MSTAASAVTFPTMPVPPTANLQFVLFPLLYFRHVKRLSSSNQLLPRVLVMTRAGVCYLCTTSGQAKCTFHPLQIHTAELRADGRSLLLRFKSLDVSDLYLVFEHSIERETMNPPAATREYFVELLVHLSVHSVSVRDEQQQQSENDVATLAKGGSGAGAFDSTSVVRNVKKPKRLASSGAGFMTRLLRGLTVLRDTHKALLRDASSKDDAEKAATRGPRRLVASPHTICTRVQTMEAFLVQVPATNVYPKGTFKDVLFFRRGVLLELISSSDASPDEARDSPGPSSSRGDVSQQMAKLLKPARRRGLLMLRQDGTFFFDTNWREDGTAGKSGWDDKGGAPLLQVPTELAEADLIEKLFLHVSQIQHVALVDQPLSSAAAAVEPATSHSRAVAANHSMTGSLQITFTPILHSAGRSSSPPSSVKTATMTFDLVSAAQMAPGDEPWSCVPYLQRLLEYLRPDLLGEDIGGGKVADDEKNPVSNKSMNSRPVSVEASLQKAKDSIENSRTRRRPRDAWLRSEQEAAMAAREAAIRSTRNAQIHTILSQLIFNICQNSISQMHAQQREALMRSSVAQLPGKDGPSLVSRHAPLDRVGLSEQRKGVAIALYHLL